MKCKRNYKVTGRQNNSKEEASCSASCLCRMLTKKKRERKKKRRQKSNVTKRRKTHFKKKSKTIQNVQCCKCHVKKTSTCMRKKKSPSFVRVKAEEANMSKPAQQEMTRRIKKKKMYISALLRICRLGAPTQKEHRASPHKMPLPVRFFTDPSSLLPTTLSPLVQRRPQQRW